MSLTQSVGIFWCYDDCPLTSNRANADILNEIQKLGLQYGPVRVFNAYVGESKLSDTQRAEFLVNGLTLSEIPPVKESDAGIEKRLIDMLAFALDNPAPSTLLLICGARDLGRALAVLRLRQYCVLVICDKTATQQFYQQASMLCSWERDILKATLACDMSGLPPASATSSERPVQRPSRALRKELARMSGSLNPAAQPFMANSLQIINSNNEKAVTSEVAVEKVQPCVAAGGVRCRTVFIKDLNDVVYPEGIRRPQPTLNINAVPGKFRYDREFLLQFMTLCKATPDDLPELAVLGLLPRNSIPVRSGNAAPLTTMRQYAITARHGTTTLNAGQRCD
ncbi:unnamed protein product [Somion occarium]|uniref:NYN domain-containing protein n=1 Tax=Somion occarium TaxID=3059160 RepID=A0ABP1D887_9APHY